MQHAREGKDSFVLSIKGASASATANLDCSGARHATIRVLFDTRLNSDAATCAVNLLESDDTTASNFATVTAEKAVTLAASAQREVRYEVDLKSRKRYLQLTVNPGDTTNDVLNCIALATLTRNEQAPAGTSDMLPTTSDSVVQL